VRGEGGGGGGLRRVESENNVEVRMQGGVGWGGGLLQAARQAGRRGDIQAGRQTYRHTV
jgi:hypothetical protein